MSKKSTKTGSKKTKDNLFQKLSVATYSRYKLFTGVFAVIVILGLMSYTTFLNREGFPPIQVPIAISNGQYFVDDADRVDREALQPVIPQLLEAEGVTEVQSFAGDNFFTVVTEFEESVTAEEGAASVDAVFAAAEIPDEVQVETPPIDVSLFLNEYNILLSVYNDNGSEVDLKTLETQAGLVAERLTQDKSIEEAEVLPAFSSATNPETGEEQELQSEFSRVGFIDGETVTYSQTILVGLKSVDGTDVVEFSETVNELVDDLDMSNGELDGVRVDVSVDFAPSILTQISSLQSNLFTGLLAVSLITLLLITWRASVITAIFMVSVVATSLLMLLLIGYSLNTITLFSLVLALGLFVDDATIIVEAIDVGKANKLRGKEAVRAAIGKVGAASFAGTFTTVLVFLPLVFVGGILGSFIRVMPITIIVALVTSFILSITLIPLLSHYFLLNTTKKSWSPLGGAIAKCAHAIGHLPLVFRKSRAKGWALTIAMIGVSFVFFFMAMSFASRVTFNIFPPSKDSDQVQLALNFNPGTTIEEAEVITDQAVGLFLDNVDNEVVEKIVVIDSDNRTALAFIELIPFTERDIKSPEIIDIAQAVYDEDFEQANVQVAQADAGPPLEQFPFKAQIYTEDPVEAKVLADQMVAVLDGAEVERLNGTTATIDATNLAYFDVVARNDNRRFFEVQAGFDADDVSSLVEAAETLIVDEFAAGTFASQTLTVDDVEFDFGQESENQESFASLPIVGLVAFVAMVILLAIQFRSIVKPFLIFVAIPFSLLGVMAGLYYTDNPISFFVMIGLFGLIGIAVNNTILLTDYANQERRLGHPIVESIAAATEKRFRPLLTTSITTVVALLPLALSDPFWEPLAYTIIFGLISSTVLVIVSFPYYYLLIEGLRVKVRKMLKRSA